MQPKHNVKTFNQQHVGPVKIRLFSRRYLAEWIDRNKRSIQRWESQGIAPKPLLHLNDFQAWYTVDELEIYVRSVGLYAPTRGVSVAQTGLGEALHAEIRMLYEKFKINSFKAFRNGLDIEAVERSLKAMKGMHRRSRHHVV